MEGCSLLSVGFYGSRRGVERDRGEEEFEYFFVVVVRCWYSVVDGNAEVEKTMESRSLGHPGPALLRLYGRG
ncbi:hypothetical protein Pyn_33137 [Prunus yedoensis var. nudiflora]|uniref:Uncharacterized protein n=1 Tax=Prunus yedoensis var. nudiflora TaxID=2094558 RepID=A0A314ZC95_PRUYE|nr:hypothetical protein Pyn_33137 [Prunus yedoensis var. nudiflora]